MPLLFLFVRSLVACASDDSGESEAETPSISFVTPADGSEVAAGSVDVSIAVLHFLLVPLAKHSDGGAEGHIVFTSTQGSTADTFDTSSTTFSLDLLAGDATLTADLAFEDGDAIAESFPDFRPATVHLTVN
jgi:hypothetical protein